MQTTLVILKPDTIQRALIWEVISRLEKKWLLISWMKMIQLDDTIIHEHYDFLVDKPFFPNIVKYMKRSPVVVLAISWKNAIKIVRTLTWATNPEEAIPWSIRWDLGLSLEWNIIHASDSEETAQKELNRFFKWETIYQYKRPFDDIL